MANFVGKHALVVLEDNVLASLAMNAAIVREFPFLKSVLGAVLRRRLPLQNR